MPALANVVLKDHADADVTFVPRDSVAGLSTLVNSSGVPAGEKTLTVLLSKTQTGKRKGSIRLALPVVQDVVVSGISKPTKVRTAYADIQLTFDDTSTTTERQDMRKALDALMSTSMVTSLIDDLNAPY